MTLTYDEIIEAMARALSAECGPGKRRKRAKHCAEGDCACLFGAADALSALRALAEERGYRLMVPVCPTMAMELEWREASHPHTAARDWAAMLSAAPDPTKEPQP